MELLLFIGGMIIGVISVSVAAFLAPYMEKRQNPDNPWHHYNESPENRTHVLAFFEGRYVVMFYRDSMYELPNEFVTNRVERWMYIPGNTK